MRQDSFSALGLSSLFLDSLERRNISNPTAIQRKVIKRLLSGESLIFRSATGTGKTFAYLLPLLEQLATIVGEDSIPRGVPILLAAAPTFELCSQIKSETDFLLKGSPAALRSALLIGSASMGRQIDVLKRDRPEVIVGNPGRILALSRTGKLKLGNVRFLILDEGDRLVQDELFEETREMVSLLKPGFLGTACSATLPEKSRQRLLPLLGIPAEAAAACTEDDSEEDVLREKVEHWALFSSEREKLRLLRSLLAALGGVCSLKALIFTGRGRQIESISSRLRHYKIPAAGLWGGMDKARRKQTLDAFRSGRIRFLVTSDLAARGLDIAGISHVIALDVSEDRDIYIHRSGRTARAGKGGVMVSIGTGGEMRRLAALEKNLGLTVYPKVLYEGRIIAPLE